MITVIKNHSTVQNMIDVDSKKGRCTPAFSIHKENDMQKQQKWMLREPENRVGSVD